MPNIIVEVLSTWQVITIFVLIMIVLPTIFYFASFDKNPVKIKKKLMKNKPVAVPKPAKQKDVIMDEEDYNQEE